MASPSPHCPKCGNHYRALPSEYTPLMLWPCKHTMCLTCAVELFEAADGTEPLCAACGTPSTGTLNDTTAAAAAEARYAMIPVVQVKRAAASAAAVAGAALNICDVCVGFGPGTPTPSTLTCFSCTTRPSFCDGHAAVHKRMAGDTHLMGVFTGVPVTVGTALTAADVLALYFTPETIASGSLTFDASLRGHKIEGNVAAKGDAAFFNGSGGVVVPSLLGHDFGAGFTVSFWFTRARDGGQYMGLVNTGYHTEGSWEVRMGSELGGTMIGCGVRASHTPAASATMWDFIELTSGPLQRWHHVIMSFNGDASDANPPGLTFFIDGVQQKCKTGDLIAPVYGRCAVSSKPVMIGGTAGARTENFIGLMRMVTLYSRAVSPTTATALYAAQKAALKV